MKPERWDKYELKKLLGTGGMAEVFLADKIGAEGFKKPVCLKRVLPHLSSKPEFQKMFISEAQIAATLDHPNIVQVFDFASHDDRLFMAMEVVNGLDLLTIIEYTNRLGLQLPVEFSVHVMLGLLAALGHAHGQKDEKGARPVIHRDVSPHNILVSQEGIVKLTDFGIAKAKGLSVATQVGEIKGKYAYMSPEQAAAHEIDHLSDLFSAGLVFFEMLTGCRFNRGSTDTIAIRLATDPEIPEVPSISYELNAVLKKMSAAATNDRYQTAQEAQRAIRAIGIPEFDDSEAGRIVVGLLEVRTLQESQRHSTRKAAHVARKSNPDSLEGETNSQDNIPAPTVRIEPQKPQTRMKLFASLGLVAVIVTSLTVWALRNNTVSPEAAPLTRPSETIPKSTPIQQPGSLPPVATLPAETPIDNTAPITETTSSESTQEAADETTEEVQASIKTGHLEVNVRPWANVRVDGRNKGTTPLKKLRFKTGNHRVILTNDELGYKKTINVKIRAGKTTLINETILEKS